jgi:biopolymer transport protein TolR
MASRLKNLLLRRRKRGLEEAEMDITPMIDCTFLLLIFFLVTSRMRTQVPLDLPKARHGAVVSERDSVILTVIKGSGDAAEVYRGNSSDPADRLAGNNPVEQEEAITRYVEQQASSVPPKRYVLIKAERGLKHREVSGVQRAASRADVEGLYVAVVEAE